MQVNRFDHVVLTVASIEATVDFYTRVLGMTAVTFGPGRTAVFEVFEVIADTSAF